MKRSVTVSDLRQLASEARESVWAQAKRYGREPKIYLHWTAGHYNQTSDHYHINITGGGEIYLMAPLDEPGQGTWKRNTGAINIAICGCFDATTNGLGSEPPTAKQIETLAEVTAAIADGLWLTIDKTHVMTHGEAAANEDGIYPHEAYACWNDECHDGQVRWDLEYLGIPQSPAYNPWATDGSRGGDVLRGKANYYRDKRQKQESPSAPEPAPEAKEAVWQEDMQKIKQEISASEVEKIAVLARKYESCGDPACVSSGAGDLGGISYGLYQLASNVGSVDEFLAWLCDYPVPELANYGKVLSSLKVNSEAFIQQWKDIGTIDPGNFGMLQDAYIMERYYGQASRLLCRENFCADKHTTAMKAVILSRAVQNGASGCTELFKAACETMGYPNLSYVDDPYFDGALIAAIYDLLIAECDSASDRGDGIWRSKQGFCNGSKGVIAGLKNRFIREKTDALDILTGSTATI